MIYALCLTVFAIGLYGACCKKNIVKIILGLMTMGYAVNLFLILVGYRKGGLPPILEEGTNRAQFVSQAVDPLPQAMVITSIVIELGLLLFMVGLAIRLYEKYGTFDVTEMRRLRG